MSGRKRGRRQTGFRRAGSQNMTRDQAMLKHKKERLAILKRRRRLLITAMAGVVAAVVLLIVFLTGGFEKKASETTLTVKADGSITFEEVDVVDAGVSESEIASYAKDAITAYNGENGRGSVKFKKCDVSDGVVYLKTIYKDAETYAKFTGLNFFSGTVEAAQKDGYSFNASFVTVGDGKKGKVAKVADVKADGEKKVVILDQPVAVVVPSEISCVSDEGTSVEAGNRIRIGNAVESYIIY